MVTYYKSAVRLRVTCRMSFTLYTQCPVVFHQRFSSTVRKAQNVSESECESESDLIRLRLVWPDVPLGDIKHGDVFVSITR